MAGTKGKATRENIELAFEVYRTMGGNKSATLRELKKEHDFVITRDTLYSLIKDYRFDQRRVEADAKSQADKEASLSAWARSVSGLLKIIGEYDRYMFSPGFYNDKGRPDNMAVFAYTSLLGQLRLYLRKLGYIKDDDNVTDEDVKRIARGITDGVADDIREKILGVAK